MSNAGRPHRAAPSDRTGGESQPWVAYASLAVLLAFTVSFIWGYSPDLWFDRLSFRLSNIQQGNQYRQIGLPLLTGLGAYWLRQAGGAARLRLRGALPWALIVFLGIAATSLLWTDDLALSVRRLAVVTMLLVAVFGTALRLSATQVVAMCAVVCGSTCLCGLGSEIVFRQFTPWSAEYRFAGVMHPNLMAANCALATLASAAWSRSASSATERRVLLAGAALFFVLLVLTKSRTAFGAALVAATVLWAVMAKPSRVLAASLVFGVVASAAVLVFGESLFAHLHDAALLGRAGEATKGSLSSRLPLWEELFVFIQRRPWTGYGYGAFWSMQHTISISAHQGWVIPHAHNSYIEMTLETGLFGGLAYASVILLGIATTGRTAARTRRPEHAFALAILLYFALNMSLEAFDFDPTEPPFVYLVVLVQAAFVVPGLRATRTAAAGVAQPPTPRPGLGLAA